MHSPLQHRVFPGHQSCESLAWGMQSEKDPHVSISGLRQGWAPPLHADLAFEQHPCSP